MSTLIFVYGTLKEGFPNFGLNAGRRLAGVYRTRQTFPFYVVQLPNEDRAPWLMNSPGEGHRVVGQVFEVDSGSLQAMDVFEEVGLPQGYIRVEVELEVGLEAGIESQANPNATKETESEANTELVTHVHAYAYMKPDHQLADCLAKEGPYDEYTLELAVGYRLEMPG